MPDPALLDLFQRLGLALAIGFLVGVERGWKHREDPEETRVAGLRTYTIIGLLGGVSAALSQHAGPFAFGALTIAFIIPWAAFKYHETLVDRDLSVTGAIAGLVVFALGALCVFGDMRAAAAAGVALTAILAFKQALHAWLARLTWQEISSALFILAATAIALPLLPDRALDRWGAINPRELWLLTILVAGVSFAGYVAIRLLGDEAGRLSQAAVGAIVSSTIVTADIARQVREKSVDVRLGAAAAALAAAVSLVRVSVLSGIAATQALPSAAPALGAAALVFALAAFLLNRVKQDKAASPSAPLPNPLELRSVFGIALLLALVIAFGRIATDAYGQLGLLPFAATAGIADIDVVALAAGALMRGGLNAEFGAHAILVAALVNTASKGAIAAFAGGWRFAGLYFAAASASALAGAAVWLFVAGGPQALFNLAPGAVPG